MLKFSVSQEKKIVYTIVLTRSRLLASFSTGNSHAVSLSSISQSEGRDLCDKRATKHNVISFPESSGSLGSGWALGCIKLTAHWFLKRFNYVSSYVLFPGEENKSEITSEKPTSSSPTKPDADIDDSTDFGKIFLTRTFLYGAAVGAALLLFLIIILLMVYCCLIRKRGEKKTLNERATVDLENGLSEKFRPINRENPEEATQPLCSDDEETPPDENEDDYLTPVEDQTGTPVLSQNQCKKSADQSTSKEPVYANANDVKEENIPLSNTTTIEGAAADIKKNNDADEKDREDSTPFDKVEVRHNSAANRYQDLKRIYENCTKGRIYMNLHGKKDKKHDQSGAAKTELSTDSSQGDSKSCDLAARKSSAAYINVK